MKRNKIENGIGNKETNDTQDYHEVFVKIKELPSYSDLAAKVNKIVAESSWRERCGNELMVLLFGFALVPVAFYLLASETILVTIIGGIMIGLIHGLITNRFGHFATHGTFFDSERLNNWFMYFIIEICGAYSCLEGHSTHIKMHHPHTNIHTLGDSSSWKVPVLPAYIYMFLAPLLMPMITPLVALQQLIEHRAWLQIARFVPSAAIGIYSNWWIMVNYCKYEPITAFVLMFAYRAVLSIPWIHVNIFQHLGLPMNMYSKEHRPQRVYQMATGVLNVDRNIIFDIFFGDALVYCHIEHHLFPRLNDTMCRKIKPIVKKFLLENGLPYHERSYMDRLMYFVKEYDAVMVKAPPLTHFVGIQ